MKLHGYEIMEILNYYYGVMELIALKNSIPQANSCNTQLLHISMYSWHPYPLFSEISEELGSQDSTISL